MPVRNIKNTSYETKLDRHTTEEIAQLNPEQGALVFDTTTKTQKIYTGTEWVDLQSPEDWRVKADLFVSGSTELESDLFVYGSTNVEGVYANGYSEFYDDVLFDGDVEFSSKIDVGGTVETNALKIGVSTFSSLPAAGSVSTGTVKCISDASAISYRGVATGGGSDIALVMSDGTNWIYH